MSQDKLILLGTGTSVGVPMIGCHCDVCSSNNVKDNRLRTSAYITINGIRILIDIGPDFRAQALQNNISDLEAVLLTHSHRDHVAGFDDIRNLNFVNKKTYDFFSDKPTWESVKKQFYYAFEYSPISKLPQFRHIEVGVKNFNVKGLEIIPINVIHGNIPCLGFRINNVAYITDASEIPTSEEHKLENLDVLVLNALRHQEHKSHFTLSEAVEISQKYKPKKTLFTHISHQLGLHDMVQSTLPENIFLGYDGMTIAL